MEAVDSFRYTVVRTLCCPVPLLPKSTPLVGGKTVVELLVSAAVCAVVAAMIATLQAKSVGNLADYLGAIAILFSFRKVAILRLLGIPFERGLYWHKVLSACYLTAMLIHGLTIGETNTTGLIIGVVSGAMALVYLLAYFQLSFNAFYYLHIACYCILAPVVILHGGKFMGYFAVIWGADLLVRYLLQGRKREATLSLLGEDIVCVSLPNPFKSKNNDKDSRASSASFEAGQYVFLMVPAVNAYEYHPFTIASAPHDDELVLYVKSNGDWTEKLRVLAQADCESGATTSTTVFLEGPYGKLSVDAFNANVYPVSILVSGGVGVTPMLSMLAHYAHEGAAGKLTGMKKIVFVWTVRDKKFASKLMAEFFQPLFEKHFDATEDARVFTMKGTPDLALHFHVHVTNNRGNTAENGKVVCVEANNSSNGAELVSTQKNASSPEENAIFAAGRPDLAKIFAQAADAVPAENKSCLAGRVSVSVCGPKVMVDAVRTLQVSASRSTGSTFDLHEELFNF